MYYLSSVIFDPAMNPGLD